MPASAPIGAPRGHRAYGLYAWLTFSLITLLTILMLALTPGERRRRGVVRRAARLILRLTALSPRVSGLENLPAGPCIVVSNHASYLDGMILSAVLPPRFTFVVKREMTRVPLAHFLLRRIGVEFVERNDPHRGGSDARRILNRAQEPRSLVFFPEGTFTADPGLGRFRSGAFVTAARGRVPVVPITIRGSRHLLPAEHWLVVPGPLAVVIMRPIAPASSEQAAPRLMTACRQAILDELNEPDLSD